MGRQRYLDSESPDEWRERSFRSAVVFVDHSRMGRERRERGYLQRRISRSLVIELQSLGGAGREGGYGGKEAKVGGEGGREAEGISQFTAPVMKK